MTDSLMSPAWGGNELSNVEEGVDTTTMNHFKVYCLQGDACQMD